MHFSISSLKARLTQVTKNLFFSSYFSHVRIKFSRPRPISRGANAAGLLSLTLSRSKESVTFDEFLLNTNIYLSPTEIKIYGPNETKMVFDANLEDDLAQIVPGGPFNNVCSEVSQINLSYADLDFAASPANSVFSTESPAYDCEDIHRLLDDVQQVPFNGFCQLQQQQEFYATEVYSYSQIKTEPKTLLDLLNTPPVVVSRVSMSYNQSLPQRQTQVVQQLQQHHNYSVAREIERVQEMALRQALDDSLAACKDLHIPTEPIFWSSRHVHAWVLWASQQYNLGYIDLDKFNFEGYYFCQLDEAEMKKLAPSLASGEILFSLLHMMNTRAAIKQENQQDGFASHFPIAQRQQPASPVDFETSSSTSVTGHNVFSVSSVITPEVKYDHGSFWEPHAHSPAGSLGNDSGFGNEPISDVVDDDHSEHGADNTFAANSGSHTHLWQFLKELLGKPSVCGSAIRWVDRSKGIFKIEDSVRVARLWGRRKNRPAMNYDKLSRSIRQYYKKGIMKKTERSQRLVYQFCAPYAL